MAKVWHTLFPTAAPLTDTAVQSILALAVLLGGCGQGPISPDSFQAKPGHAIAQIPSTGQLHITLQPGTFNTVDFMELHGCALQITLGKYQSRLGQFASESQRLLLDLEYLNLAPDCIALKRREHQQPLAEQLLQEKKLKLQQLPSRIFNATFANTEFQRFWNRRSKCCDNPEQYQLTISAFSNINGSVQRWLLGDYQASNIEFEIQLSEISKGSAAYMQSKLLRASITKLETQLRTVLPLEYQRWRELRNTYWRTAATPLEKTTLFAKPSWLVYARSLQQPTQAGVL